MPAAKGRRLPGLLALLLAVAIATPAAASIPRDTLLEPDPQALLAAVDEAPELAAPAVPTVRFIPLQEQLRDRFELLPDSDLDRLVDGAEPQQLHLFAEPETRLRAFDLPAGEQPQENQRFDSEIASGVPRGPNLYQGFLNNPVDYRDPMGLGALGDGAGPIGPMLEESIATSEQLQRQKWERMWREDIDTVIGALAIVDQVGGEVSNDDLKVALNTYLQGRPRYDRWEAAELMALIAGPGNGLNAVADELTGMRAFAEFAQRAPLYYLMAAAGGVDAYLGVRGVVTFARSGAWRSMMGSAGRGPAARFFGDTRLEVQALQRQGLSRAEAFERIRSFNTGQADGYLFHYTNRAGAQGILESGEIVATQRGLAGPGVYSGTTPTPNLFQRYFSPVGWGMNPGSSIRIPLRITPEIDAATRTPWLPRWTRVIGEGEAIPLPRP